MAAYFIDSSGLVKRYVVEIGSKWILDVVRPSANNLIYVAQISGVEVISALARKRKGALLDLQKAAKATNRFEEHFNLRYQKINGTTNLISSAMKLADKHALRGYDAVQLAVALEIETERKNVGVSSLIFVSADNELNNSAKTEGLAIENPNNYP